MGIMTTAPGARGAPGLSWGLMALGAEPSVDPA